MSHRQARHLSYTQRLALCSAWRSTARHTLERPVELEGIGAHSGLLCRVRLTPLHEARGLVLNGLPISEWRRDALWATRLTHPLLHDTLSTPEHLLAALYMAGVDDLEITVIGAELPILDGSASPWLSALHPVPTEGGTHPRVWRTLPTLTVTRHGGSVKTSAERSPAGEEPLTAQLRLSVAELYPELLDSHLDDKVIRELKRPLIASLMQAKDLWTSVAVARTFGLRRHEASLRANGLIKGVSEDNCLILDDHGVTHRPLRHPMELASHKLLDCLGDLALSGERWRGHLELHRGSHALNHALLSALESH